jgi:hypothetical protein
VRNVLPQWARDNLVCSREETDRVWPVHASRAFRDATIQSVVPSRWRIENVVVGVLVEMRAVIGVVAESR